MSESDDDFIHGPQVAAMKRAFDEGLEAIQKKHQTFFDETPSKHCQEEEHKAATIGEFVLLQYDSQTATVHTAPELPIDIAREVKELFHSSFPS